MRLTKLLVSVEKIVKVHGGAANFQIDLAILQGHVGQSLLLFLISAHHNVSLDISW